MKEVTREMLREIEALDRVLYELEAMAADVDLVFPQGDGRASSGDLPVSQEDGRTASDLLESIREKKYLALRLLSRIQDERVLPLTRLQGLGGVKPFRSLSVFQASPQTAALVSVPDAELGLAIGPATTDLEDFTAPGADEVLSWSGTGNEAEGVSLATLGRWKWEAGPEEGEEEEEEGGVRVFSFSASSDEVPKAVYLDTAEGAVELRITHPGEVWRGAQLGVFRTSLSNELTVYPPYGTTFEGLPSDSTDLERVTLEDDDIGVLFSVTSTGYRMFKRITRQVIP